LKVFMSVTGMGTPYDIVPSVPDNI
jgi:hypothetical protein